MAALSGVKVIEFAGIGPGPFSCMLLADRGADVIRIDRAANVGRPDEEAPRFSPTLRGRPNVAIDLKNPQGRQTALTLCDKADILIEGFRPGVMERLGLGPEELFARNAKLVYGRMTGWGQDGPIAQTAGHDINYIALSGALHAIGTKEKPVPPLNLVGDFGGGALYLVMGVLAAYIEAQQSGKGQVVDVSMVEGAASLMTMFYGRAAAAREGDDHVRSWTEARGSNFLDGGSHYYNTYETADGEHICIGSIEPQFYQLLLNTVSLTQEDLGAQNDKDAWPSAKEKLAAVFKTKTRDEWTAIMTDTDICFAPVLKMSEAPSHPHNAARGSFVDVAGVPQPAPAPKFSRTNIDPGSIASPAHAGEQSKSALNAWGFDAEEVERLAQSGAIKQR